MSEHARSVTTVVLSTPQQRFVMVHYEYAQKAAVRVAYRLGVNPNGVDDLLENAAVDALLAVARRTTDPDFLPGKAKPFLLTAVYRSVRNVVAKFLGWHKKEPHGPAVHGLVEHLGGSRLNPLAEVMSREDETVFTVMVEHAKAVLGPLPDIRKWGGETPNEWAILRAKLREFGLSVYGSIDELRDRLAAHVRGLIAREADPVPAAIQNRLRPLTAVTEDEDEHDIGADAERFVRAWESAVTVREVCHAMGWRRVYVREFEQFLRGHGVRLKRLPATR